MGTQPPPRLAPPNEIWAPRLSEESGQSLQLKELLNVLLKNVPAGIAMLDRDMRYIVASDRWCEDYNVDCSKILGRSHYELFPDIPERWKETHRRALAGEVMRADADRWDRKDGTAWVCWQIHPWKKEDGTIGGILIFAENLTRSKQTEETLATISSKLVQIQEEERTRIARDLHDDVNQRLALLGLRVDEIKDNLPIEALEVRCQLGDIKQQIDELSTGVQSISRQLHSPQLEYLGLIPAMDAFCREFSERHKVRIRFIQEGVAKSMPHNISLCLFRILQEALHNAAKHSTVHQFDVRLRGHHQLIDLTVSDGGVGFDADGAINSGLGLLSMRERARMVNGTISIDSKPKGGTTIRVSVPLP